VRVRASPKQDHTRRKTRKGRVWRTQKPSFLASASNSPHCRNRSSPTCPGPAPAHRSGEFEYGPTIFNPLVAYSAGRLLDLRHHHNTSTPNAQPTNPPAVSRASDLLVHARARPQIPSFANLRQLVLVARALPPFLRRFFVHSLFT